MFPSYPKAEYLASLSQQTWCHHTARAYMVPQKLSTLVQPNCGGSSSSGVLSTMLCLSCFVSICLGFLSVPGCSSDNKVGEPRRNRRRDDEHPRRGRWYRYHNGGTVRRPSPPPTAATAVAVKVVEMTTQERTSRRPACMDVGALGNVFLAPRGPRNLGIPGPSHAQSWATYTKIANGEW